jgi:hypothetical protein
MRCARARGGHSRTSLPLPIALLVEPQSRIRVLPAPKRRRFDPVLLCALAVLAAVAVWTMAPLATSAVIPSVTSDTRIEVEVPVATSVTPGWTSGDTSVRLPDLSIPGDPKDVTSPGWKMSTNWTNGYEVRIRATSDPALRGSNATDNKGARSSFDDYKTTSTCPCAWSGAGFTRAIFGYSASVVSDGPAALDTAKWGTSTARKWRGFTTSGFPVYSTAGGTGEYTMSIHFRSMIPEGASQLEGSYRAGIVVSAHPIF